jgi:hypothetical protein
MSPKNVGQLEARTRASSASIDIGKSCHRACIGRGGQPRVLPAAVPTRSIGLFTELSRTLLKCRYCGALEATVLEQHLDGANVSAQIEQMGRERVPKAMWRDALGDPRLQSGL